MPLRKAHEALDLTVAEAYGWERDLVDDAARRNRALFELNAAIVEGAVAYQPY